MLASAREITRERERENGRQGVSETRYVYIEREQERREENRRGTDSKREIETESTRVSKSANEITRERETEKAGGRESK